MVGKKDFIINSTTSKKKPQLSLQRKLTNTLKKTYLNCPDIGLVMVHALCFFFFLNKITLKIKQRTGNKDCMDRQLIKKKEIKTTAQLPTPLKKKDVICNTYE